MQTGNQVVLHAGNSLDVLKGYADNTFHACVTDAPYGLSFMGKKWDYDVPSKEIWEEVLRVLKPGGYLLSFAGTRTQHRMAVNIEDAGFEIRDMIAWISAYRMPKHVSCLKPALEPITLARKPAKKATPLNIDACRIAAPDAPDEAVFSGNAGSRYTGVFNGGKVSDSEGRTTSATSVGRWPANVILEDCEEVFSLFPDSAGSGGSVPNVKITGYGDGIGNGTSEYFGGERKKVDCGTGSAARFFYSSRASKKDRNEGLPDGVENTHTTVKPTDLMRYLCRLVTPLGGTVLDPFMGSGSTGKAAVLEGFNFVGIDLDPAYVEIAKARIEAVNK